MTVRRAALLALVLAALALAWRWGPGGGAPGPDSVARSAPAAVPGETLAPTLAGRPGAPGARRSAPDEDAEARPDVRPPAEIPEEDRVTVTVVDVATGRPVPGLRVVWAPSRRRVLAPDDDVPGAVADASGRVVVPASNLARLSVISSGWLLYAQSEADMQADGQVFVVRTQRVVVTVVPEPGATRRLDPLGVRLFLDPEVDDPARDAGDIDTPLTHTWLRAHHLDAPSSGTPDETGRVTFDVVAGVGFVLKGRAPGWRAEPVVVAPPAAPASGEVDVRLTLHPVPVLRGKVVDAFGRPVAGARVRCSTKATFATGPEATAAAWRERLPEFAVGVTWSGTGGIVILARASRCGGDGSFVLDLVAEQEFVLVTQAADLLTDVRTLRTPGADVDLEVVLRAADASRRLPIALRGRPLPPGPLTRSDVTDPDFPVECSLEVGADGTVPADEFVAGRAYLLLLPGEPQPARHVRWDARDRLDLDALETDFARFRAAPR